LPFSSAYPKRGRKACTHPGEKLFSETIVHPVSGTDHAGRLYW